MNEMYVLAGFQLPANVVCLNGPAVERHLLVNKEPRGTPRFRFPTGEIDGILLNLEGLSQAPPEEEFVTYLKLQHEDRRRVSPVRYRLLFVPLVRFIGPKESMVRSLGGEVVRTTGLLNIN